MNAYQRAQYYLKTSFPYTREEYKKIDELIEPLCHLLTEKGYITLHSCSAHIGEETKKSIQWYVLFVATKNIKHIQKIVKQINKKHNYQIKIRDTRKAGKEICKLTRRWVIEYFLHDVKTKEELIQINQIIYQEFVIHMKELKNV